MRKFAVGLILVWVIGLLVGCEEPYDPTVHDRMVKRMEGAIKTDLSENVAESVYIEKMDKRHEYEDRGEINDYRVHIRIKDVVERGGEKYTKHEWWTMVHRIDQIVSSNQLIAVGTPSEGAYNTVSFHFGDEIQSFSGLSLNYFGEAKTTYREFMTQYYDDDGNPVFYGGYNEGNEGEWIHQF